MVARLPSLRKTQLEIPSQLVTSDFTSCLKFFIFQNDSIQKRYQKPITDAIQLYTCLNSCSNIYFLLFLLINQQKMFFILVHLVCLRRAAFPVQFQPPSACHQSSQPRRLVQTRTLTATYCKSEHRTSFQQRRTTRVGSMENNTSLDHFAVDTVTWFPDADLC